MKIDGRYMQQFARACTAWTIACGYITCIGIFSLLETCVGLTVKAPDSTEKHIVVPYTEIEKHMKEIE